MTIGTFNTLLDEEEEGPMTEEAEALEDMTPEKLAEHIRALVEESRRSRRNRALSVRKGDLKGLAAWEREITSNYGVSK